MEDKTFELLTKMYSEFTEFRQDMNAFRQETNSRLNRIGTTIEHDIKNNLKLLNEHVTANTAKLDEHTRRLDSIENKLDYLALSINAHDKRLEVVESRKKKRSDFPQV